MEIRSSDYHVPTPEYRKRATANRDDLTKMNSSTALFAGLVTAANLLCQWARASSDSQVYSNVLPSVVTVVTLDDHQKELCYGTGFFYQSNLVVTNRHVVLCEDNDAHNAFHYPYAAVTNDGTRLPLAKRRLIDTAHDLAFLLFEGVEVPSIKVNFALPVIGQHIIVIGSPKGLVGTLSAGIVSAIRENGDLIQITAPITHGSSGSPVMNENGEVIGVAVKGLGEADLNFAISIRCLRRLVKEMNSPGLRELLDLDGL
jgi:S1-C subfamily serine protease